MPIDLRKRIRTAFDYATAYTLRKMIMVELSPGQEERSFKARSGDYIGVITLTGDITGHCTLQVSEATAREAIARLTGEATESVAGISDGVGEFANMIAGNAKATLQELSVSLSMPKVTRIENDKQGMQRFPDSIELLYTSEIGDIGVRVDAVRSSESG
jgi:chemotaxis protein CheX